jgi:hypothetical protein
MSLIGFEPAILSSELVSSRHLERIVELFQAGAIRPPEIKLYRLSDAADAHRLSESRHSGASSSSKCVKDCQTGPRQSKPKFDPTINYGHLLTALSIAIAGTGA